MDNSSGAMEESKPEGDSTKSALDAVDKNDIVVAAPLWRPLSHFIIVRGVLWFQCDEKSRALCFAQPLDIPPPQPLSFYPEDLAILILCVMR